MVSMSRLNTQKSFSMSPEMLLAELPATRDHVQLIEKRQTVSDIKKQIEAAHKRCGSHYDLIAYKFLDRDTVTTLKNIFNFLKANVEYVEETEEAQFTKDPAVLLEMGQGDCKMYASFIGGILDALNRQDARIDWVYAFASYDKRVRTPGHVFIIVTDSDGTEYWVDPVLDRFNQKYPVPEHLEIKRVGMALYHLSGIGREHNMPANLKNRREAGVGMGCACDKVAGIGDWVKANPMLSAGIAVTLIVLLTQKKRGRA